MTTVKDKNRSRFDEPVTKEGLNQAIERGSEGIHATALQYVPHLQSLMFGFADHSAVALPVHNYPELAALGDAELHDLTLGFGGSALCLEARDLHISIAGLFSASQPLMNMAASLIAARYNTNEKALQQPTPAEIKAVRTLTGLTQQKAAEMVHRASSARWREWESGKHQIDMAVWELFMVKTGLRTVELGLDK